MAECKALRTFNSDKYGFIRAGSRFSSEVAYAHDLKRNGLCEILVDDLRLHPLKPDLNQAVPRAPQIKEQPSDPPPAAAPLQDTADPQDAGQDQQSLLSRVVRASRRKTSKRSED